MLVLGRRRGESILIGEGVEVRVLGFDERTVRLGVSAPRDVLVLREEFEGTRGPERSRRGEGRPRGGAKAVSALGGRGNGRGRCAQTGLAIPECACTRCHEELLAWGRTAGMPVDQWRAWLDGGGAVNGAAAKDVGGAPARAQGRDRGAPGPGARTGAHLQVADETPAPSARSAGSGRGGQVADARVSAVAEALGTTYAEVRERLGHAGKAA